MNYLPKLNAYHVANFAHWAYRDRLPAGTSGRFFESKTTDTQGFVISASVGPSRDPVKVGIVAFRGSKGFHDWMRDFFMLTCPFGDGFQKDMKVHAGAMGAWESVQDEIIEFIGNEDPERVVIAGHSLGGQLCYPAAERIWRHCGKTSTRVTFGAPPFGKTEFAEYMRSMPFLRHLRFRAGRDFVSFNPLHQGICGYRHDWKAIGLGPWYDVRRYSSHYMGRYKRLILREQFKLEEEWRIA